jgi:hypothetical protein
VRDRPRGGPSCRHPKRSSGWGSHIRTCRWMASKKEAGHQCKVEAMGREHAIGIGREPGAVHRPSRTRTDRNRGVWWLRWGKQESGWERTTPMA